LSCIERALLGSNSPDGVMTAMPSSERVEDELVVVAWSLSCMVVSSAKDGNPNQAGEDGTAAS
jgi:hypothetical protein